MVQTIVTHRRDSFSCEKPGWLFPVKSRDGCPLNQTPQGVIAGCCPDLPAMLPSTSHDSRQKANISRFIDRSEAQMRSVVDHDIREHNAVMTVVADKPVHGDEETSSLVAATISNDGG